MDISELLAFAAEKRASDLILTAGSPPVLRIDGEMRSISLTPLDAEHTRKLLYDILSDEQISRLESDWELDFSFQVSEAERFRGNAFFQQGQIAAVFRLIPSRVPTLDELGLPLVIEDLAMAAQGLILVTGPTGHGKSTTQAAMINLINERRRCHIVTIEDPIEFVHTNKKSIIAQREVGADTKGFFPALRHVLRQAPDVILIGEMRDLDTIRAALTAAETGHLVISTLHTNDAVQSIDRLVDSFPPHHQNQVRAQLSLSLLAVIAQRLLPRADGHGRIVAVELLRNNSASAHLIRDGKIHNIYTVMETHVRDGMCTLDASLIELYRKMLITRDEARRCMRNPEHLKVNSPSIHSEGGGRSAGQANLKRRI